MPWNYERIAFYMRDGGDAAYMALLRAWNGSDHLYTTDPLEYLNLPASYVRQGIAGYVAINADADHVPLYRLYHPGLDDTLLTASAAEYQGADVAWRRMGGIGYVVPPDRRGVPPRHRPVFRAFSPDVDDHFYSMSATEVRGVGARVRTFVQPYAAFPHVPRLVGEVVGNNDGLNRGAVVEALPSGPWGDLRGRVDFVVCYNANGGGPDHGTENFSYTPRILRGIIQHVGLRLDADARLPNVGGLNALTQEVLHHWIAYNAGRATIETAEGTFQTPTAEEMWRALNQGLSYPPFPMIGRQDSHWSPFFDDDSGPMEGGNYGEAVSTQGTGFLGWSGRHDQVQCLPSQGPSFNLPDPNGGVVNMRSGLGTFDRWLTGEWTPPKTTTGTVWPSFRVMEPRWVFPIGFQAGLYVELTDGRRFYLGFLRGPHELGADQADGTLANPTRIQLGAAPYDPHEVVGLRLVQLGQRLALQVRVWPQRSGCLFGWLYRFKANPDCAAVMQDLVPSLAIDEANNDHYSGWRTVHVVDGRAARVGLSSRTLDGLLYTRLSARLCLLSGGTTRQVPTLELEEDIPQGGPIRLPDGRLIMPYANALGVPADYRETATVRRAPKWTLVPPHGDFAFGGRVTLESCTVNSWAGGTRPEWMMVGRLRTARYDQFRLPADPFRAQRIAPPPNNTYKMLFCLAAREDTDITDEMVSDLDLIRRVWELYFPQIQSRTVDTLIDY